MRTSFGALAISLVLLAGCETEVKQQVRVKGPFDGVDDAPKVTREKVLLSRVEQDPKDAQGWFVLGEYYESSDLKLVEAVNAYERGNALIDHDKYIGGYYLLARGYMRLQQWDRSISNLNEIFAREPKDPKQACLNPYFREAHYIRGAIFYIFKDYRNAKRQFVRFLEIGGEEARVEEWLTDIQSQGD